MQVQLKYNEFKKTQKKVKNKIIFVLENLEHFENIGSAFRIADSFNIEQVFIICNNELNFNKIHKTARNCENIVPYKIFNNIIEVLAELKKLNYIPINLEITSTSLPLREIDFNKFQQVALICGNESNGLSENALKHIKRSCFIEMYGINSSMNVTHALAIATYKISEDFLKNKGE